jgi:hypothetical protein
MQNLEIKGQFITLKIESMFSKTFSEDELVLIAASMLKAYVNKGLKAQLAKFDVKGTPF